MLKEKLKDLRNRETTFFAISYLMQKLNILL